MSREHYKSLIKQRTDWGKHKRVVVIRQANNITHPILSSFTGMTPSLFKAIVFGRYTDDWNKYTRKTAIDELDIFVTTAAHRVL